MLGIFLLNLYSKPIHLTIYCVYHGIDTTSWGKEKEDSGVDDEGTRAPRCSL